MDNAVGQPDSSFRAFIMYFFDDMSSEASFMVAPTLSVQSQRSLYQPIGHFASSVRPVPHPAFFDRPCIFLIQQRKKSVAEVISLE